MDKEPPPDDYEVGYGKPPRHSRFVKGQSGNPKGRPRKLDDESLRGTFNQIISQKKKVTSNGGQVYMTTFEMMIRQLAHQSSRGNVEAAREMRQWIKLLGLHIEMKNQDDIGSLDIFDIFK